MIRYIVLRQANGDYGVYIAGNPAAACELDLPLELARGLALHLNYEEELKAEAAMAMGAK